MLAGILRADVEPTRMNMSLQTRIAAALVGAAVLPMAALGLLLWATGAGGAGTPGAPIDRDLLFGLAIAAFVGMGLALILTSTLIAPLRAMVKAMKGAGDDEGAPRQVDVPGDDDLAFMADRYNQLIATIARRERILDRVRTEVAKADPALGAARLVELAGAGATAAFEMTSGRLLVGKAVEPPAPERVPGDPVPIRATARLGNEDLATFVGMAAPTRDWAPADQQLLELYVTEMALAIRNAELREPAGRRAPAGGRKPSGSSPDLQSTRASGGDG